MKYDKKAIEESGVDYVKKYLRQVNTLDPNILYNDKTASWDGNILVYQTVPFVKSQLRAKIPAQVKTRNLTKYKSKYPVSVVDLKNYKKDGSILYFLVQIVDGNYKIFYAKLFLIDLERYIHLAKAQQTISISFTEFPKDIISIQALIEDYIDTANKQKQLLPEVFDLDTFISRYPNRAVSFNVKLPLNPTQSDIISSIIQQQPYLYYECDKGISVPVGKFEPNALSIITEESIEVKVNDNVLFSSIEVETFDDRLRLKIGSTITIDLSHDNFTLNYSIKDKGILDSIHTLQFIIALINNTPIYFNGKELFTNPNITAPVDGAKLKQQLDIYLEIQTLFSKLGIRKDLVVQSLSETEYKNLMMLCHSELYDKEVPLGHSTSRFGFLHIGDIHILCFCRPTDRKGYYITKSIFDRQSLSFALQDGKIPVGSYLYLVHDGIESFRKIDNINYDDLKDSLNVTNPQPIVIDAYNHLLLNMISYYDEVKYNKTLGACIWLAQYLWDNNGQDFDYVNLCQVKYRMGKLSYADKHQLVKIKSSSGSTAIKLACSILLQAREECEIYYSQLPSQEQETFNGYPIYHIWKMT